MIRLVVEAVDKTKDSVMLIVRKALYRKTQVDIIWIYPLGQFTTVVVNDRNYGPRKSIVSRPT